MQSRLLRIEDGRAHFSDGESLALPELWDVRPYAATGYEPAGWMFWPDCLPSTCALAVRLPQGASLARFREFMRLTVPKVEGHELVKRMRRKGLAVA